MSFSRWLLPLSDGFFFLSLHLHIITAIIISGTPLRQCILRQPVMLKKDITSTKKRWEEKLLSAIYVLCHSLLSKQTILMDQTMAESGIETEKFRKYTKIDA